MIKKNIVILILLAINCSAYSVSQKSELVEKYKAVGSINNKGKVDNQGTLTNNATIAITGIVDNKTSGTITNNEVLNNNYYNQ